MPTSAATSAPKEPEQRLSLFSHDATIDGFLDADAWDEQLKFIGGPASPYQRRLVLYTMSATRLFETALFSRRHFLVVAEFLNFVTTNEQEEDAMSVDGSEHSLDAAIGTRDAGDIEGLDMQLRPTGFQSLPTEIALVIVRNMKFSDRAHFAGASEYASDLVATTLHLNARRLLQKYKLCFAQIRLMQTATGAVIAGSTMTDMVATQPLLTSGDSIDIVAPSGKGHAVVDYLQLASSYTIRSQVSQYNYATNIARVWSLKSHSLTINVIESLTENVLDVVLNFKMTCVYGIWTAKGVWHAYPDLTEGGIAVTTPVKFPLQETDTMVRRAWRALHKYMAGGMTDSPQRTAHAARLRDGPQLPGNGPARGRQRVFVQCVPFLAVRQGSRGNTSFVLDSWGTGCNQGILSTAGGTATVATANLLGTCCSWAQRRRNDFNAMPVDAQCGMSLPSNAMLARLNDESERSLTVSVTPLQELDRKGEIVTTTCSTFDLLPLYTALEEADDILRADSAEDDLQTLDSALFWEQFTRESPRRSSRLLARLPSSQPLPIARKRRPISHLDNHPVKNQRLAFNSSRGPVEQSTSSSRPTGHSRLGWLDKKKQLVAPTSSWTSCIGNHSPVLEWKCDQFTFEAPEGAPAFPSTEAVNAKGVKPKHRSKGSAPHKRAGTKQKYRSDGSYNPAHQAQMVQRTFKRADAMISTSYSIVRDAPVTSTGWHGISPQEEPKPWTYRPEWLMHSVDEVQEMVDTLVGHHLASQSLRNACAKGERGPHFPCIIGYHRQSAKKPFLTSWHQKNKADVDAFLALPITQRIIKWVSSVVKLVFPGVAASFEKEAAIILDTYGIAPQFGLFWNLCLNAAFEGQDRIHCDPHADRKNRIGVCGVLTHILRGGEGFNHFQRTWLVIWEAGVVIQLPPWVLVLYPSALFYHFNIDIDQLEFVSTEGTVDWPTRDNSRPVVAGDEWGRGSMVFFNQSTMTQTAFTGHATTGTTDFGTDAQAAFSRHAVFVPLEASRSA
ncbi:hypothetical protein C8R47DRAFT_1064866 [Mycena vitilis]|nr:hypothetical protein C8R47DRAFT_1064866 [Mycena vitilis]